MPLTEEEKRERELKRKREYYYRNKEKAIEYKRKWRQKNKDRERGYRNRRRDSEKGKIERRIGAKRYREKYPEKIAEMKKKHLDASTDSVNDFYVKRCLTQNSPLNAASITQGLIDLKRQQILIKRAIKERKQA